MFLILLTIRLLGKQMSFCLIEDQHVSVENSDFLLFKRLGKCLRREKNCCSLGGFSLFIDTIDDL